MREEENLQTKTKVSCSDSLGKCISSTPTASTNPSPSRTTEKHTPKRQKTEALKATTPSTPFASSSADKQIPKKHIIETVKETVQKAMDDLDLYITSALYNFSKNDTVSATEKLEKARRLNISYCKKSLAFIDEVQVSFKTKDQAIDSLKKRESFLLRKNNELQSKLNMSQQDMFAEDTFQIEESTQLQEDAPTDQPKDASVNQKEDKKNSIEGKADFNLEGDAEDKTPGQA